MAKSPDDMILPMLRDLRERMEARFDKVDQRLGKIEHTQKGFRNALAADSLMSKMMVGDWEERIEALEKKVRKLEAAK